MAMIKCPECTKQVSDTATKCTHCGVRLRKPTRTGFGKFVKWGFIGFNVLMIVWLIGGMGAATEGYDQMSEAEQAGTAIGAGIGMMMIFFIWAVGDIILAIPLFLTRPKD